MKKNTFDENCLFTVLVVVVIIITMFYSLGEDLGYRVRIYPESLPAEFKDKDVYRPNDFSRYNEIGLYYYISHGSVKGENSYPPRHEDTFYYCGPLEIEEIEHLFLVAGNRRSTGSHSTTVITTGKGVFLMEGFQQPSDGNYVVFSGRVKVGEQLHSSFGLKPTAVEIPVCPGEPREFKTRLKFIWQK